MKRYLFTIPALLVVLALAGCKTTSTQVTTEAPGASEQPAAVVDSSTYTEADVEFMQGMITHHAQAVRMSSLAPSRTNNDQVLTLSRRIAISQRTEIVNMSRWLRRRGQSAPEPSFTYPLVGHAMHGHHMPGMLTPAQMAALASADGVTFDRLFLNGMIQHHIGALTMVDTLFEQPGAAQDVRTFELANSIAAEQRSQITSMRIMLSEIRAE